MRKIIILLILVNVFLSCNNSNEDSDKSIEKITDAKTVKEPIDIVKLFIESLGSKDFETAYDLQIVEGWEVYKNFSSTSSFGGINATSINEIKEIEQNTKNAKIYVDAYYYDPVNGDNRFQQFYFLRKIGKEWRINKLEQIKSSKKTPKQQISKILSRYTFFDNTVNQRKNENTFYSFELPNLDKLYIVFTSNEEFIGGHYSYCYMSVFLFNIANGLQKKFVKSYKIGSNYDSYAPVKESVKIHTFGNDFILLIEGGSTQMGESEGFTSMYYIKGKKLLNIAAIQTQYDNGGSFYEHDEEYRKEYRSLDGDIRFLDSKTNLLPVIELYTVTQTANEDGAMNYKYYSFDGNKYIETKKEY